MTWETFNPPRTRNREWVSVAVYGRGSRRLLSIAISEAIVDYLGVEDAGRVVLQPGRGEHAGWLRIRPGVKGGAGVRSYRPSGRSSAVIRISAREFGVSEPHSVMRLSPLSIAVDEDRISRHLSLELPPWAWRPGWEPGA